MTYKYPRAAPGQVGPLGGVSTGESHPLLPPAGAAASVGNPAPFCPSKSPAQDSATLTDPQQIRIEMIKLRLLQKRRIDPQKGCWIWTGTAIKGSGVLRLGGTRVFVHRLAIALWKGIILTATQLAVRTCGTDRCFNPDHREIQTKAEVRRNAFRDSAKEGL